MSSSSSSPPSSSSKSSLTKESFQTLLSRMDSDLAINAVLSAISLNVDKMIEVFLCGSEVMYYREILKEMKKPLSERTYSLYELRDMLKDAGWFLTDEEEAAEKDGFLLPPPLFTTRDNDDGEDDGGDTKL